MIIMISIFFSYALASPALSYTGPKEDAKPVVASPTASVAPLPTGTYNGKDDKVKPVATDYNAKEIAKPNANYYKGDEAAKPAGKAPCPEDKAKAAGGDGGYNGASETAAPTADEPCVEDTTVPGVEDSDAAGTTPGYGDEEVSPIMNNAKAMGVAAVLFMLAL